MKTWQAVVGALLLWLLAMLVAVSGCTMVEYGARGLRQGFHNATVAKAEK